MESAGPRVEGSLQVLGFRVSPPSTQHSLSAPYSVQEPLTESWESSPLPQGLQPALPSWHHRMLRAQHVAPLCLSHIHPICLHTPHPVPPESLPAQSLPPRFLNSLAHCSPGHVLCPPTLPRFPYLPVFLTWPRSGSTGGRNCGFLTAQGLCKAP